MELSQISYPILDTRISVRPFVCLFVPVSSSGDPPCILKQGGLKRYGQILTSSNGKTKIIAFYRRKKKFFFNRPGVAGAVL